MAKPTENWRTGDSVPFGDFGSITIATTQPVVRSGALCLKHDKWSALVWDGERLGPECCLVAGDG